MFLVRIDDRFIHGQVGVKWISYCSASEVLLANDVLAADSLASTMQKLSAPAVKVTIRTVLEAVKYILNQSPEKLAKLFVIVSCPQDVVVLLDQGVQIEYVNIGHSAHKDNCTEIHPYFFVGPEELAAYQELEARGIELDFRLVPDHKKVNIVFKDITI